MVVSQVDELLKTNKRALRKLFDKYTAWDPNSSSGWGAKAGRRLGVNQWNKLINDVGLVSTHVTRWSFGLVYLRSSMHVTNLMKDFRASVGSKSVALRQ